LGALFTWSLENNTVLPGVVGHQVLLYVQNSDVGSVEVASMDLVMEVYPGDPSGPRITGVDTVSGTLLGEAGGALQVADPDSTSWLYYSQTLDLSEPFPNIAASERQLLATVFIDTTGVSQGNYEFRMSNVAFPGGDPFSTSLYDGNGVLVGQFLGGPFTITVVPEPGRCAIMAALALAGFAAYRRTRNSSAGPKSQ